MYMGCKHLQCTCTCTTQYCSGMTVCVYIPDCSRMTVWLSPHTICCAGPGSGTSSLTGCPCKAEGEGEGEGEGGRKRTGRGREGGREGGRGRGKGKEREREEGGGVRKVVAVMYCSSPVFSVALA